jgi:predicted MFS family arabinose efflux permease
MFRDHVAAGTDLGKQVEAIMAAGDYVPDQMTVAMLAYPIAGWVGATWGMRAAVWCAAGLVACGVLASLKLWPRYPGE